MNRQASPHESPPLPAKGRPEEINVFRPGDRVEHPEAGPGFIVGREGNRYKVRFRRLVFDLLLPARELRRRDGSPSPPSGLEPGVDGRIVDRPVSADAWERRVLEACRFGILDSQYARELTVGREPELYSFNASLTTAPAAAWGILGDYGSGKTHLLTLMAEEARRRGFLTSFVTIDPLELRPCNPKRLYRSLLTHLRYPDRSTTGEGLAPLLDKAIEERHWEAVSRRFLTSADRQGHRYLHALLLFWFSQKNSFRDEHVEWAGGALAWISAQDEASSEFLRRWVGRQGLPRQWFPALPDHRTRSHTYTYLLTGIAALARAVGYRGLVVLLDEAEYHERLRRSDRQFGDDFFARLLYAALRPESGALARWEEEAYRGGQREAKAEPTLFEFPAGLVPVIAATPGTRVADLLYSFLPPDRLVDLRPLGSREIQQLIVKLGNLYWGGFGPRSDASLWPPSLERDRYRGVVTALGEWARDWMQRGAEDVVRPVIRSTVHVLDLVRHGRIPPPRSGRELMRTLESD
ncbi:MAG: hypothetical protein GF355_14520 [Candidatus Eisenbacteria bacterium]|nr:hypothetical protein [Candidatus Eisenbacteria bacterium]